MKRFFDLTFALIFTGLLLFPLIIIFLSVRATSRGPGIYWSFRVGRNNKIFSMPKFRSMYIGTPSLATDLIKNPDIYLTPIGSFLRRSSLDELPQLWSIFKGDMSFVGPRPALYNQHDLVRLRSKSGVDQLVPGLTGWAQINGRDNLTIKEKVNFDKEYLRKKSFIFDLKILYLTFIKIIQGDGVQH